MSILNIQIQSVGLAGVLPSVAYITTNNSQAEVLATGYLNKAVEQGNSFPLPCMAVVATKESVGAPYVSAAYNVTHVAGQWGLELPPAAGVTPANVQGMAYNYGVMNNPDDPDEFVMDLDPPLTEYPDGLVLMAYNAGVQNMTPNVTLSINGLAPIPVGLPSNNGISVGDLTVQRTYFLTYDASNPAFFLYNPAVSYVDLRQLQNGTYITMTDTGIADAYIGDVQNFQLDTNMAAILTLKAMNTNTGASTLEVTGIGGTQGTYPIVNSDGSALQAGQIISGGNFMLLWNLPMGWILINPAVPVTP